jgi:hypothetical protein
MENQRAALDPAVVVIGEKRVAFPRSEEDRILQEADEVELIEALSSGKLRIGPQKVIRFR